MIYNGHEILLRKNAKVDYTLDDDGKVIAQDQTHIEPEISYEDGILIHSLHSTLSSKQLTKIIHGDITRKCP